MRAFQQPHEYVLYEGLGTLQTVEQLSHNVSQLDEVQAYQNN
jgi:hypothetical protein